MLRESIHAAFGDEEARDCRRASDRIRDRLVSANVRHHANDNISAFIEEGEMQELMTVVQGRMLEVLRALVIDTDADHNTRATAQRVAKMYVTEVFRGRYVPPPVLTEFPNASGLTELMVVGPLALRSACAHHLCPIVGKVWIGVLPNKQSKLIGLSKYARVCDWVMSRPQIQEEAVVMLADALESRVKPDGLAIVIKADHLCMHWRGVKDEGAASTNSVMRGDYLKNVTLRRAFMSLLNRHRR